MSIRERARELSVQALYQYALRGKDDLEEIQNFSWMEKENADRIKEQAGVWLRAALADLEAIDVLIEAHLAHWTSDRVGAIERAILRLAVYELKAGSDTAVPVVIDEAVKLAKRYCDNDSFKFVNGVLDAVATTLARKA
jgi:N utilization substance protein B